MKPTATSAPIIERNVSLPYSKGSYQFTCKTTAKLFIIVFAIMQFINHVSDVLTMSQYEALVSCLWIVNHEKRKLEKICSVSSSVFDNMFCKCRIILSDCICKYCYAHNQQSYQNGLREHNVINGLILRNILIPVKAFRKLNLIYNIVRVESFGDVANVTQARNYIRIIKAFPRKRFGIWSKNIAIWEKAFEMEGKPENCTYVHSSKTINKPDNIDLSRYWFIDHIFTVYTKAYATKHNIVINCGGRKCMECIKSKKELLL